MYRLTAIGIDVLAEAVIIIPLFLLLFRRRLLLQRNWAGRGLYVIFAFYLTAVCSATGMPDIYHPMFQWSVNWVPLVDAVHSPVNYMENSMLNVALFVPAGFLAPLLWEEFRLFSKTVVFGAAMSFAVEILQIFTLRLTDVDDLLMNTLGCMAGYGLARLVTGGFSHGIHTGYGDSRQEILVLTAGVYGVWAVLHPYLASCLWEWVLSAS